MSDRPILIIDGLNCYMRAYAAYPQMSSHGYQMGGTIGFLKTLQRLVRDQRPKTVYIAWESGGSTRRRSLFSEYKLNRRPEPLNRFYEDDIPETAENKKHQMMVLVNLLKNVPVCQIYVSDCEGDDVIAHLCRNTFRDQRKTVGSSDKDMYQLLDDSTMIYSFHKKTFVTSQTVFEEFRVKPHNFAIAKSLCGDSGDNVPGIKGLGFKKVAKLFPQLGSDERVLLQHVFDYSHTHEKDSKLYARVLEHQADVERNWKLVSLEGAMLSASQVQRIEHFVDTYVPSTNKIQFMKHLINEGINNFDIEEFFYVFNCIDRSVAAK